MTRRLVVCSMMVASGLWFSPAQAQDLAKGEKETVFIGALTIQPSVQEWAKSKGRELTLKRVADSLESQLITALNATRVFQIVERKRIADLQAEQAFAAVAVNPGDKNAAQQLKFAGAKYAFLPQIDGFEDRTEKQRFEAIDRVSMGRKLFFSAVVKVVDTTTGKLLPDAPSVQLNKTEAVEMARNDNNFESDQIIVELAKEMASQLSQDVVTLLHPAKVLMVTGKQILINRGTEAGFHQDDMVEVYAVQEVKDEDSGETFRNEVPVGHARVVRGDARQSFGMIEGEDTGIAKGCVAKVVKAALSPVTKVPLLPSAPGASLDPASVAPPVDAVSPGSSEKPLKFE